MEKNIIQYLKDSGDNKCTQPIFITIKPYRILYITMLQTSSPHICELLNIISSLLFFLKQTKVAYQIIQIFNQPNDFKNIFLTKW